MNRIDKTNIELKKFYLFLKNIDSRRDVLDIVFEIRNKNYSQMISLTTAYKYLSILRKSSFCDVRRVNTSLIPSLTEKGQKLREILKDLVEVDG